MVVRERPELTENYSAIDGIGDVPVRLPVRSDIQPILDLDDTRFDKWYSERREAVGRLLSDFELICSVPNLFYGSESQKYGMDANAATREVLGTLRKSMEYLGIIKNVRDEYRS